jgi:hypothetical protein
LTQALAAAARRRARRLWTVAAARGLGLLGILALFVGAGGVMMPTVIGGGLASARPRWPRPARAACLLAAAAPVGFVGSDIVGHFGWSLHALAGFLGLLVIYGIVVRATWSTLAPVAGRPRLPRWATITIASVLGLAFLVPLVGGGIK